jgi:hypothetical protein
MFPEAFICVAFVRAVQGGQSASGCPGLSPRFTPAHGLTSFPPPDNQPHNQGGPLMIISFIPCLLRRNRACTRAPRLAKIVRGPSCTDTERWACASVASRVPAISCLPGYSDGYRNPQGGPCSPRPGNASRNGLVTPPPSVTGNAGEAREVPKWLGKTGCQSGLPKNKSPSSGRPRPSPSLAYTGSGPTDRNGTS